MNINDFNIDKYDAAADDRSSLLDDSRSSALRLIDKICMSGTDITDSYQNWLHTGFALASEFGEEGRQYFHRLSQMNPGYKYEETDKKYSSCMKSTGHGITIKTLFHLAKEKGVEIASSCKHPYSREERVTRVTGLTSVINTKSKEKLLLSAKTQKGINIQPEAL